MRGNEDAELENGTGDRLVAGSPTRPNDLKTAKKRRSKAKAADRSKDSAGGEKRPKKPRSRARKIGMITLVSALGLFVISAAGGAVAYYKLNSNIRHVKIGTGYTRPTAAKPNAAGKTPVNVLIMGSDTRSNGNGAFAGGGTKDSAGWGQSDTLMLLHIAADHKSAEVMSLPRDSVVPLPACSKHTYFLINAAYAGGGPACTVQTVETLTHIHIDHFIVVTFGGFVKMIDAIGGVPVCLTQAVNDPIGHIHLPAGHWVAKGTTALNFVREREALGDGGDRSRITRQHAFISSMINQLTSAGVLANPVTLWNLANAATSAIIVDDGLGSVSKLVSFANSIKDIPASSIHFFTVANEINPAPAWNQHLAWVQPLADQEFQAIANDTPLTAAATAAPSATPSASPTVPAVSGTGITVTVYNGSTTSGLAGTAAHLLTAHHFTVAGTADASSRAHQVTVIEYGPGHLADAQTLAQLFPGARLESAGSGISLIVGSDFAAASSSGSTSASPTPTPSVAPTQISDARTGATDICQGINSGD